MGRESTRERKRENKRKKRDLIIVGILAIAASVTLIILTIKLRVENQTSIEKLNNYESQIAEEEARADELEAEKEYMQGKEFIEKIARERLGLVSPSDTIIKPEE